jgi:hypothetical protein
MVTTMLPEESTVASAIRATEDVPTAFARESVVVAARATLSAVIQGMFETFSSDILSQTSIPAPIPTPQP